jgi:hypothetical protein
MVQITPIKGGSFAGGMQVHHVHHYRLEMDCSMTSDIFSQKQYRIVAQDVR